MKTVKKRVEGAVGGGGYSRPVILIEVVGGFGGRRLFDGADEAVVVVLDG